MKKLLISLTTLCLLTACGKGSPPPSGGSTGGGGTSSSSSSIAPTVLSLGNGSGSGFAAGVISLSATSISAGGSATLSVSLVDQKGVPYTQSATITFSSSCLTLNQAVLKDATNATVTSVQTTTGSASVTYVAQGCSGADVITASTTANSQSPSPSATGTITVQPSTLGAVSFVSASPTTIGLKGTGIQETSTLIFLVSDSSGGAVSGADVAFSLTTSVGGISLSSTTAKSGADGRVQTVVKSGTVHTSVRVTATATLNGVVQSTQSSNLSVTTGIPTTGAFTVSNTCPNVEAFNIDGVNVNVTARLADRYNNPVPDGTAVAFMTSGGKIGGQCTTATTPTESGVCTVNWTSQLPRPANGRVAILATALGEDSFVDANANGFYDSGETYSDLGEPFEDDNGNNAYDLGEPFLDFNGDGVRNATYGSFKGITCTGATSSSTCTLVTTSIGRQDIIVMSTSAASITGPAAITGAAKQYIPITYNIKDLNGNAMAKGTTISVTATGPAGTLDSPTSFVVPCDGGRAGTTINVFLTIPATTPVASGALTVTVTSPGGLITTGRTTVN